MFFVSIIFLFFILLSNFLSNFKLGKVINFIITLLLLYIVFLFITYTPDKEYYNMWINSAKFSEDKEPTFKIIAAYIREHNYGYQFFHVTFLSIYSIFYLFFISRFSRNVFIVTLLYIPCIFIFYGTQLRYFMGYYSILLGIYYLTVVKNWWYAILFIVFALASHYSLLLFIPIYFLLKIENNFFRKILRFSIVIFIAYMALVTLVLKLISDVRFLVYLQGKDMVSSYLGGIFVFAPIVPIYFLIEYYYNRRIKLNPNLASDSKFAFLYKMTIIPLVFLGLAVTAQVIGHRMIMPAILFPILLFFYKFNDIKDTQFRIKSGIVFLVYWLIIFIHFNYSTAIFLGEWDGVENMYKMIQSNGILNEIILYK